MKCPCESAGNPRTHGVMCHYAGLYILSSTTHRVVTCGVSGALLKNQGESTRVFHDRRLCVAVCDAHYAWRQTTSVALGHSKTCPEAK